MPSAPPVANVLPVTIRVPTVSAAGQDLSRTTIRSEELERVIISRPRAPTQAPTIGYISRSPADERAIVVKAMIRRQAKMPAFRVSLPVANLSKDANKTMQQAINKKPTFSHTTTNGKRAKKTMTKSNKTNLSENGISKSTTKRTRAHPAKRQKLPPIPFVTAPPFNPITTDLTEDEIRCRLFIREFVFRFEQHCRLSLKHINIVNDVTGNWVDTTFKAVTLAVLKLLYADNYPVVDGDMLKLAIKEVEKTASERIWPFVVEIIHSQTSIPDFERQSAPTDRQTLVNPHDSSDTRSLSDLSDVDNSDSLVSKATPGMDGFEYISRLQKLKYICDLIFLCLTGNYIRETLEIDAELLRSSTVKLADDIRKLEETQKNELNSLRSQYLMLIPQRQAEWDPRFEAAQVRWQKEMRHLKAEFFRRKRKLVYRNLPIGTDIFGNEYWLFAERGKSLVGWGSWIMCFKASSLPSPTGSLIFPSTNKMAADEPAAIDNDDASTSSELSEVLLGDNDNWYSIESQEDAIQLTEWIQYSAEMTFRQEAKYVFVHGIGSQQI
ncbi:uncharacterized protein V1518DRAFT_410702 [Limtongia smithiae]|uniref:uncharacterized protein n=1 Tax=Limtongia smithiae TaxID=1125753 RepID=UPI0034CD279D